MSKDNNQKSFLIFYLIAGVFALVIVAGIVDLARQFSAKVQETQQRLADTGVANAGLVSVQEPSADVKRGRNLYFSCAACHGANGEGNKSLNAPALNVQEDWYLVRQLKKFKDGIRGTDPRHIPGMQMQPMAMMLKDEKAMEDLAGYIVSLRSTDTKSPDPTLDGDVDNGRRLYASCMACHGDRGQGNENLHAPGLVGQHDWYLAMQIKNFKEGIRGSDPRDASGAMMRPMAMTLPTEQAIHDVAVYLLTLPISSAETKSVTMPAGDVAAIEPNAAIGKDLFAANCAACHQENGEGLVGLAPSIRNRDFLAIASDNFIKKTVTLGRPGTAMIARPDLSDNQLDHLIAYLRSLPVKNPVNIHVDTRKVITGDPVAGSRNYAVYCASCHGPNGEGYSAGGSGPAIGLSGFLFMVSDDYILQTVKHGRVGTAMRSYMGPEGIANLSESDVHDIIAHLRTLAPTQPSMAGSEKVNAKDQSVSPSPHKGEAIFATNCAACHQQNGEGKTGLAPSIRNRDFLAVASDEFIKQTIRKGRIGTSMVARPDLAENDLDHIIAFLRALPIANPVDINVDPRKKVTGDLMAGRTTFGQYCASCHGANGEGYSAGGSGPGIGLSGFLQTASDDFIFQTVKHGRIGTAMKSFVGPEGVANLAESDVNNIIAFLRSL